MASGSTSGQQRRVAVIIPVLDAEDHWAALSAGLKKQTLRPDTILMVDSSSTDRTKELAEADGYQVLTIPRAEFQHGATRQRAAEMFDDDWILVYLTHDAYLASEDSLLAIVRYFENPKIGAAFGRQLPHANPRPIEAHARYFNYPEKSQIRDRSSIKKLGFRAIFSSNNFAAYRKSALQSVGGFPTNVIISEETVVFARMLLNGWKTVYAADATVYHSHWHSWSDEFRRYFDVGVLHSRETWMLKEFGDVRGEGMRYVLSMVHFLLWRRFYLIVPALGRTLLRFLGYRAGRLSPYLGHRISKTISQQNNYWK